MTTVQRSSAVQTPRRPLAVLTLIAAAMAAVLTACGGPASGPTEDQSSPTADFTQHGPITLIQGKDTSGWTQGMIAQWNKAHPDEIVTLREAPSLADQQRQQLLQAAQIKDSAVAVMMLDAVWTAEFAANSYAEVLPQDKFPMTGYLPQTIQTVTYFGKHYAVPFATGGGMLYYRKDLLQQAGVEVPTTWAEMKAACKKVRALPGKSNIGCYGGQFNKYEGLTVNVTEAVASAGGQLVTPEGQATANSDEAKQGLGFLATSFKDGTIPKAAITWGEEEGRQAFQNGNLVFLRNWSYVYSLAENPKASKVAGKFAVAPLPGLNGPGVSTLGGNNYAITTFGKNKGTAVDFINFMRSPEAQKSQMLASSQPPPLASVYTDKDIVKKYPFMPTLLKSIETAQPRPVAVRYGDVTIAIQDASYSALEQRTSVDDALNTLQSKLGPLLQK